MAVTSRLSIPKTVNTDTPRADIDGNEALDDIDNKMAYDMQGTIASRPAASIRGRYYTATDESNTLYRDTGSTWVKIYNPSIIAGLSPVYPFTAVTALPGTPVNGQHIRYKPSGAANSPTWFLVWDSTNSKWYCIGGEPLEHIVTTSQTTTSTVATDLTTVGPQITLPYGGKYALYYGGNIKPSGSGIRATMSYIGSPSEVTSSNIKLIMGTTNTPAGVSGYYDITPNASTTITVKYHTASGTATFSNRWMKIFPIYLTP